MISPRCHLLLRHDIYDFTEMPFFYCATIFMISPRCHLSAFHDTFRFARTPFACKTLTPVLCGGATSGSLELKIMPPSRRPHQHRVRKDSLNLPRFHARIEVRFLFLPRLCFLLFHTLYSSPNFNSIFDCLVIEEIIVMAFYIADGIVIILQCFIWILLSSNF